MADRRATGFYWVQLRGTTERRVAWWMAGLWWLPAVEKPLGDGPGSLVVVVGERLEPPPLESPATLELRSARRISVCMDPDCSTCAAREPTLAVIPGDPPTIVDTSAAFRPFKASLYGRRGVKP